MLLQKIFYYIAVISLITTIFSMEEETVKEYGIVVFPSFEVGIKAAAMNINFSTKLPGENPNNIWHVTLHHLACNDEALIIIENALASLVIEPFTLNFKDIYSTADRWIDWGIENTEPLHRLHQQVLDIATPHSLHPLARANDIYDTLSSEKKAQVDSYGVSGVLELYNPHMTLFYRYPADVSLRTAAAEFTSANLDTEMSCYVNSIGLVELDYNGNITRLIKCINIKNSTNFYR